MLISVIEMISTVFEPLQTLMDDFFVTDALILTRNGGK